MGIITNIQHFSLHDGPGIRTTVFLKGCNMRCAWCHNPETINPEPETLFHPEKCILCGQCDKGCFSGAKVPCGREMSAAEVIKDALQDKDYYGADGGITVSGGEPLMQVDFTREVLSLAREAGIGTAVETNMSFPFDTIRGMLENADVLLCDLKVWDSAVHKKYTGIGNAQIKHNISLADTLGIPIVLHTPVICSVNDTIEEMEAIGAFAGSLKNLMCYELLPYHPLGLSKGSQREQIRFDKPDAKRMEELARAALRGGCEVRVAGKKITE